MAQGVSKDCIFNEAFGHVFKSAVGAVELLPVGVGVGIERNRTSPARLSELVSISDTLSNNSDQGVKEGGKAGKGDENQFCDQLLQARRERWRFHGR